MILYRFNAQNFRQIDTGRTIQTILNETGIGEIAIIRPLTLRETVRM